MPQFILKIDLGNGAVTSYGVCRALKEAHDKIYGCSQYDLKQQGTHLLHGANGNVVGHYEVVE